MEPTLQRRPRAVPRRGAHTLCVHNRPTSSQRMPVASRVTGRASAGWRFHFPCAGKAPALPREGTRRTVWEAELGVVTLWPMGRLAAPGCTQCCSVTAAGGSRDPVYRGDTEAQGGLGACSESQLIRFPNLDLNPGSLASGPVFLTSVLCRLVVELLGMLTRHADSCRNDIAADPAPGTPGGSGS